jgi:hypothetical protein
MGGYFFCLHHANFQRSTFNVKATRQNLSKINIMATFSLRDYNTITVSFPFIPKFLVIMRKFIYPE